jgi:rod shape-determining protein MreC
MADSQTLKGADAAALEEQRKASEIMAERLPGLTDPNAPPVPAKAQQPGANGLPAPPAAAVVPKIIPPAHPDRFTPGNAPLPESSVGTDTDQAAPKPKKPAVPKTGAPPTSSPASSPRPDQKQSAPAESRPAQPTTQSPKPANPQPQRER